MIVIMKRSIKRLPKRTQEELAVLQELILQYLVNVRMIILYGSYARGEYVIWDETYDERGGLTYYQSDLDILVICDTGDAIKAENHANAFVVPKYDKRMEGKRHPAPPQIIVERYLINEEDPTKALPDYKFFCFNGVPKYVVIYSDREENTHNYSVMVYDMDWNAYPEFVNSRCPISDIIPRPSALEEMISIASRLSEPFPFVRVDLYLINGSPIFGEMTFTPDVISNITPELTDQMSKWIDITSLKQQL